MKGIAGTSILVFIVALNVVNSLEAIKVLHIPEKIIGGVIDIVQSHKNKPATGLQGQNQQQSQQGFWNSGFQTQNQNQAQHQYGNYGYPQSGTYPQGGYGNNGQNGGSGFQQIGGPQAQNPGQYQNYPQNQSGGQFQVQNQQSSGQQSNQFQNQIQNGFQGQQTQMQAQSQQFQNQNHGNGQFSNQNSQGNLNFQGAQQGNQQVIQNPPTGGWSNQNTGSFVNNQQSGNYGGQGASNHYVPSNQPQGQLTQTTSFVGQNHQTSQFQTGTGSYGGSQGFQTTTDHHTGIPGPTCVCQAWTKPQNPANASVQRNEDKTEKPVETL